MKKLSPNQICLILILLFSFWGMKSLFHPGLFTAHDMWHQVVRLYYYYQGINDGQFPTYWVGQLANGFGYPLFFFSYPLPWLVGVPLIKLGFDIPTAIKALFFLSYLGSGITMYLFVNSLLKNKLSALVSAILYLWLPYHFLITFVSASIGIAFIFTFLPLVFLGIHLMKEGSKFSIPIFALGISGIILSHIMHLFFLLPVILLFILWELTLTKGKINFLRNILAGLSLGFLISAFYLVPASYYNQFTRIHQETGFYELYKRNFINFNQLLYSKWGFSPIVNNAKNGEISFQLGFAQWISIFSLFLLIVFRRLNKSSSSLSIYLLIGFIASIFLMLDQSVFIWTFLVKTASLDFPFRFLLPATFIASICAGIVLSNINKKLQFPVLIFFTVIALYTNRNHINVNQYTNFPISTYLNIETEVTTNTFNEYLPLQSDPRLLNKPWNEILGNNLSVSNLKRTTNLLSFDLSAPEEITASAGQFFFPGQTFYLDQKITKFDVDQEGRISFLISKGIHTLAIRYKETTLIKAAKFLTIIGIIFTLILFGKAIKLSKKKAYS